MLSINPLFLKTSVNYLICILSISLGPETHALALNS